ncbi:hypothetical protein G6F62_015715 [Rhizopus arrhizus]|nr:hypothetical protein G6F62_015715 [Rhizopus arrhizus]
MTDHPPVAAGTDDAHPDLLRFDRARVGLHILEADHEGGGRTQQRHHRQRQRQPFQAGDLIQQHGREA